jgi:RimJ/RimL family protein N-acetyltransferase
VRSHAEFREIDLAQHFDLCVAFRADASISSFGSADPFYLRAGDRCQDYKAQLSEQMKALPGSCVHVWLDGRIVGQIEMRRDPADPTRGYVRLFHLVPEERGQGLAAGLEEYSDDLLSRAGITFAWLRVSPSNERAVRHYLKHGWIDTGPDRDTTHRMEKRLAAWDGRL